MLASKLGLIFDYQFPHFPVFSPYNLIHIAAFAISDGSEPNFHTIFGHFYAILLGTGAIIWNTMQIQPPKGEQHITALDGQELLRRPFLLGHVVKKSFIIGGYWEVPLWLKCSCAAGRGRQSCCLQRCAAAAWPRCRRRKSATDGRANESLARRWCVLWCM